MRRPYLTYNQPYLSTNSRFFIAAAARNSRLQTRLTVQARRDELLRLGRLYKPPGHTSLKPAVLDGVSCEWVCPDINLGPDKLIIYLHGGSWAFGCLESARTVAVTLAEQAKLRVLVADYRLAPENPWPAALEDCLSIWHHLTRQEGIPANHIALFGDSAGGNLCLCLIQSLIRDGLALPAGVACASPVPDLRPGCRLMRLRPPVLYQQGENGERLNIIEQYLHGQSADSPLASPILGDWRKSPPILLHAGEAEDVRDDCIDFAARAYSQGADVVLKLWYQMFHDFTIVGNVMAESRQSMEEIGFFLQSRLLTASKAWPF